MLACLLVGLFLCMLAKLLFASAHETLEPLQTFANRNSVADSDCTAAHCLPELQVMTWELLTKTKFYGEEADMATVVDTLTGKTALASERELTQEVYRGLANNVFRTTVVAMLQRDPAQRPTMASLVHSWQGILMQQTAGPGAHVM